MCVCGCGWMYKLYVEYGFKQHSMAFKLIEFSQRIWRSESALNAFHWNLNTHTHTPGLRRTYYVYIERMFTEC